MIGRTTIREENGSRDAQRLRTAIKKKSKTSGSQAAKQEVNRDDGRRKKDD
jgi:hypothetical protein